MKWISKIPENELRFEFTRSGGPGGQHVNKTNTAAVLRWNLDTTLGFSEHQKIKLQEKLSVTQEGDIIIRSEEFRDQERNKKRCLEKLDLILERALFIPKKRKATKPTRAQKEKRLKGKKIRSEVKKLRTKKDW